MNITIPATRNVYVVSDIHNCADEFKNLLKKIEFNSNDLLIIAGDIFDRGPKPVELYFEILKHPNIQVIQGNHDVWLSREIYEKIGHQKAGEYISYNTFSIMNRRLTPVDMMNLADWINEKPYYINLELEWKVYQIAHAQTFPTSDRIRDKSWIYMGDGHYKYFLNASEECDKYISVVGHTPTSNRKIWHSASGKTIRIDCGAGYSSYNGYGTLGAIRLNDMKEYYVD